jgi:hypothetical protein
MEITPFIPLTLRGRFKERILPLRGTSEGRFFPFTSFKVTVTLPLVVARLTKSAEAISGIAALRSQ